MGTIASDDVSGFMELDRHKLAVPKTLPKWTVMRLGNVQFGKPQSDAFIKAFGEGHLKHKDFFCTNIKPVGNDPYNDRKLGEMFGRLEKEHLELLLVVLPSKDASL